MYSDVGYVPGCRRVLGGYDQGLKCAETRAEGGEIDVRRTVVPRVVAIVYVEGIECRAI
jgi:hypothetical protein